MLKQITTELRSDNPELNNAFRIALNDIWSNIRPYKEYDACLCAGFDYTTPWTRDTAINIMNGGGILYPQVVRNNLFSMTETDEKGRLLCDSIEKPDWEGNYWDCVIWTLGLWYYYIYTGEKAILEEGYPVVKRTLKAYEACEFNKDTGLFMGGGVYADGISAYPEHYKEAGGKNAGIAKWAKRNPGKAYSGTVSGDPMAVLSTNCVYYMSYRLAAKMSDILKTDEAAVWLEKAEVLKQNINRVFWNNDRGTYDYMIDWMGKCEYQEALGQAYSVLFDVCDSVQADKLFDNLKSTPWGVACVEPSFPRYQPDADTFGRHSGTVWPFCQMYIAEAAAWAGRGDIFSRQVSLLARLANRHDGFYEIYHPLSGEPYGGMQEPDTDKASWRSVSRQTWSATGFFRAILAGVFGLWFDEKGITIKPVSQDICKQAELKLNIRDIELELHYEKSGSKAVEINGIQADFIPWSHVGKAVVVINN